MVTTVTQSKTVTTVTVIVVPLLTDGNSHLWIVAMEDVWDDSLSDKEYSERMAHQNHRKMTELYTNVSTLPSPLPPLPPSPTDRDVCV